jgi:LysR family cys regulon transcriptional activator
VLKSIDIILREVANLKRIGEEFSKQEAGTLSIATTHTQARYVLPGPVAQLRQRYPKVQVVLHQGTPEQVARMLLDEWPTSAWPPSRWPITTAWSPCPATSGSTWWSCRARIRWPASSGHAGAAGGEPLVTYHPTVSPAARASTQAFAARG